MGIGKNNPNLVWYNKIQKRFLLYVLWKCAQTHSLIARRIEQFVNQDSIWLQKNREMINTIQIWFDIVRLRRDSSSLEKRLLKNVRKHIPRSRGELSNFLDDSVYGNVARLNILNIPLLSAKLGRCPDWGNFFLFESYRKIKRKFARNRGARVNAFLISYLF